MQALQGNMKTKKQSTPNPKPIEFGDYILTRYAKPNFYWIPIWAGGPIAIAEKAN